MDVEKTMQFMLDMQAKHEAAVQKHDEQIARLDEHLARLEAALAKHDEQIAQNAAQIQAVTDLVGRLAQAEIRLVERINQLAEKTDREIGELREAQARSDYKLNALIETVDKLVRRNGGKPS